MAKLTVSPACAPGEYNVYLGEKCIGVVTRCPVQGYVVHGHYRLGGFPTAMKAAIALKKEC